MTTEVSFTIPELLDRNAQEYGDQIANREKEYGIWQSWTWKEVQNQVEEIALGYLALGIKEGEHIAVLGRNRPKLYWSIVKYSVRILS